MRKIGILISLFLLFLLFGCNNPGLGPEDYIEDDDDIISGPNSRLSLSLTQTTVKSDDSDSTTITASVLDENNVVVPGKTVTFTANGGALSAGTSTTDNKGQAKVDFSSGSNDLSNRVATVTATVDGLTAQIPIQIVGSSLEVTAQTTTLSLNGTTQVTVKAMDASEKPVFGTQIIITTAGTGQISVSPVSASTDVSGVCNFTITGISPGTVTLTAKGLGVTKTLSFTVLAGSGTINYFHITSPVEDTKNVATGAPITITVSAPAPTTSVIFSTTLGSWDGGTASVVTKTPSNGIVSATLRSNLSGLANVQVLDKNDSTLSDSRTIAFSAPASTASSISLQASATVMAPSTDTLKNEVRLTATVRNNTGQVVGGAPVSFSIQNPTGGGETIAPVVTFTDTQGQATAVFTSGSLPSDPAGVTLIAKLVEFPEKQSSISIIIGGSAGSIIIGRSTKIQSIENDTAYSLPMSVLVTDSSGGPVSGATVSLSVWSLYYLAWDDNFYPNEDVNEDLKLDPGEDLNGDGELTPPHAAAGSIPSSVTTDEKGISNFNLTYLKQSANKIVVRIRATTRVHGTETISSAIFVLPVEESDLEYIPPSTWAPAP